MTDLTIRRVNDDDFEEWSALFRAYRDFYRLTADPGVIDRVWGWLVDHDHEVDEFVAEVEGRLVGFAHFSPFSRHSTGTVGLYLDAIAKTPLLTAIEEVELARAIEAGLYAQKVLDGEVETSADASEDELR